MASRAARDVMLDDTPPSPPPPRADAHTRTHAHMHALCTVSGLWAPVQPVSRHAGAACGQWEGRGTGGRMVGWSGRQCMQCRWAGRWAGGRLDTGASEYRGSCCCCTVIDRHIDTPR